MTACKRDLETIEARDENGNLEKYERLKSNFAKQGAYEKRSPEGILLVQAQYKNDTLEGERRYFYKNGQVESIEHFVQGKYHGKYQKFFENGALQVEQMYQNGALNGWSIGYYRSGQIKEKVMLQDNEENGPFIEYYENGAIQAEGQYGLDANGDSAEQGVLKEYNESGQLIRVADCVDGRCITRNQ
jgi:antitoxin component YwqK of YwqJK toxin-antitoxin module